MCICRKSKVRKKIVQDKYEGKDKDAKRRERLQKRGEKS